MLRHLFRLLLLSFLLSSAVAATGWTEIESDLPPDPAIQRGVLPNGLRYAILPNNEPQDRISLRFVVLAGSLHEREDERGLAHFLEHMAFRGTRRHPNGTLTSELQRLGIGFGPDNTAFTHFEYTIYHLELPDTNETTLRQGLEVFREYAEDITFDPKLIDRERGVVLSELNTRDTPGARIGQANLGFLWPESRQVQRSPIGTEAAIRSFTREQFVSFYDAWYRPERMAVVLVGAVNRRDAQRVISEVLGPIEGRGEPRPESFSKVPAAASTADVQIFSDPVVVGASASLQHPFPDPPSPDTHARRMAKLHRGLAFAMFQRRLTNLANGEKSEFVDPSASLTSPMPGWGLASFGVSGTIANWKEFITDIEREHRTAFMHGFTAAELRAVKALYKTSLDDAVRTYPTRPSSWLAEVIAAALVSGEVVTTPHVLRDDFINELESATTAQCLVAFREAWSTKAPHVFVATNPQFAVQRSTIGQALNESRKKPVEPRAETTTKDFAYTDFGASNAPTKVEHIADLDVQLAEYPNGTRFNFKATDFAADSVQIYVRVGSGRLSQPKSKPGLDLLANSIVSRGGLRRHTFAELQDLFSEHSVGVSFYVDHDAFAFNARCSRRDLAFCLQVITAHLTDSAYRPEAMREINASFGSMYTQLASSPGGPFSVKAERILARDDTRFGVPTAEELYARTIAEASQWLEPEFQKGPIELAIVGDTNWEEASEIVGRTLGALPPRDPRRKAPNTSQHRFPKPKKSGYVYTTVPQLRQVAIARYCPVPDDLNILQERRSRLLAALLEERLRVRLREELGAAYASHAAFTQHSGFPGFNYFMLYAEVPTAHARQAAELMKKELESIRQGRFSEDEFERTKMPFLRARKDDLRSNSYWGYTVLRDVQEYPERLVAARSRAVDTAAITRKELQQIAKRYLKTDASFEFVAYPAVERP